MLGPLVFGAFLVDAEAESTLYDLGARDSKKLTKSRRQALRAPLADAGAGWDVLEVSPADIDATSLGELGKRAIVELALKFRPDVLVLDAPVPPRGIPKFSEEIRSRLAAAGLEVEVVAENGADDRHPCCSAASVFAKTCRDDRLAELAAAAGEQLGSGYPSDPVTQAWLRTVHSRTGGFPPFVRTKWETVRRIVAEGAQQRLF